MTYPLNSKNLTATETEVLAEIHGLVTRYDLSLDELARVTLRYMARTKGGR